MFANNYTRLCNNNKKMVRAIVALQVRYADNVAQSDFFVGAASMKKKSRKILILTVKLLVAAALLVLVIRKVHWSDYVGPDEQVRQGFATTISSADPYLLAASFVCFLTPLFILAFRWWYLLRLQRIEISLREVVRLTFLGTFFNYVVPGSVSGDLVKAYYAAKHTDRKIAVLVSVFIDRALGLLEFVLLPAVVIAASPVGTWPILLLSS